MPYRMLVRPLLIAALLTVLCVGLGAAAPRAIGASAFSIQGDVNCSGVADARDSLQILVSVANSASTAAGCVDGAGDVDCDGDEDLDDAMRILRFAASLPVEELTDCVAIGDYLVAPQTSESLIAAALEAGDISYEDSLRWRAYALYDWPGLPEEFRSPIIDWEAGSDLFEEVDENEGQLSAQLLTDLAPFRARPNDPISVFNNPPSLSASVHVTILGWVSQKAPATNARVWIKGTEADLQPFLTMVTQVWAILPQFFTYPMPDQALDPDVFVNPDSAIDFYVADPTFVDPRSAFCAVNPADANCLLGGDYGFAKPAPPRANNKSSGYLMINVSRTGDKLIDTASHELTHVAQYAYDANETSWLYESTATWVEYKVLKKLGKMPDYPYGRLPNVFQTLNLPLTRDDNNDLHKYGSWLFFYSASIDLGDSIVKTVWQKAAIPGLDGILAVDEAIPLDDHLPRFAVRNWNTDPVPNQYNSKDSTFKTGLEPNPIEKISVATPGIRELDKPVKNLAAVYYDFKFGPDIKRVTFENLLKGVPHAHVWAIAEIGGDWKEPEDLTALQQKVYCRDSAEFPEDITDLVIIVSNSHDTQPLPTNPKPRVVSEGTGCPFVEGWAETTMHTTDMTYTSGHVSLRFKPRAIQNTPGVTEYDMEPGTMTWAGSGTIGNCSAEGQSVVAFPGGTADPGRFGYLHAVGLEGGDWHGLLISAVNLNARLTVTCPPPSPGDPPYVYESGFEAGLLLDVLKQDNSFENGRTVFKGDCTRQVGDTSWHFKWSLAPLPEAPTPASAIQVSPPINTGCGYPGYVPPT